MDGPASENILLLSADMENLRGLSQQAAMVCNTEGGFKYLVFALFGACYRVAIVCPVWHPYRAAIGSALYGTRYRAAIVSTLYGTHYRAAIVYPVWHPL